MIPTSSDHLLDDAKRLVLPKPGLIIASERTSARYEIGELLSDEGAFGFVFECKDEWGHELVAKVIKPFGPSQETLQRATSELTAMAIARSPHIVQVHDAFSLDEAHYIISERCTRTLRSALSEQWFTPKVWLRPFIKGILHALHFVHINGLAHCDVHAGNVFLHIAPDSLMPEEQGASIFKLGDFGLARPINSIEATGTFMNCLRPPEAFGPEFGPLDQRLDIYQTGLLLLSFVAKEELRFSESEILSGAPREFAEALNTPLGVAIGRMLRRHVEYRTANALDAWRELSEAMLTN